MKNIEQSTKQGFLRLNQIIGTTAASQSKLSKPREFYEPLIPISRAGLWLMVKDGRFPKPIKLSPEVTVWNASDVYAWIEEKIEQEGA